MLVVAPEERWEQRSGLAMQPPNSGTNREMTTASGMDREPSTCRALARKSPDMGKEDGTG